MISTGLLLLICMFTALCPKLGSQLKSEFTFYVSLLLTVWNLLSGNNSLCFATLCAVPEFKHVLLLSGSVYRMEMNTDGNTIDTVHVVCCLFA